MFFTVQPVPLSITRKQEVVGFDLINCGDRAGLGKKADPFQFSIDGFFQAPFCLHTQNLRCFRFRNDFHRVKI